MPKEDTPLVASSSGGGRYGIGSREAWVIITVGTLFFAKSVQPFITDATHVTQAALVNDTRLDMSESRLGALVATQDAVEGLSKLLVGPVLSLIGPHRAWYLILGGGALNALVIAATRSQLALFTGVVVQSLLYAWAMPSTTMVMAGWLDGHLLGRAIGVVSVATKLSPSLMSALYGSLLEDSWASCYAFAGLLFGFAFLVVLALLQPSAAALGFREPSPPGRPPEADGKARSHMKHPFADESSWEVVKVVFCMRRTWALTAAFSLLVLLKSGAKFASLYAASRLGVSASEGATLFTTYAIASVFSGVFGGVVYDVVPGGKAGIGLFMTGLNLLNLGGFAFGWLAEVGGSASMTKLHVFMATIGFASVLPVSLPFQVYSMGMGGARHCGVLVGVFEFIVHFVEAGLDLLVGQLLEQEQFATWLGIECAFALGGTVCMAVFYYLDWRRAPRANSLTAAPDLDWRDKKSIARSIRFAAAEAETREEAVAHNEAQIIAAFSGARRGSGSSTAG